MYQYALLFYNFKEEKKLNNAHFILQQLSSNLEKLISTLKACALQKTMVDTHIPTYLWQIREF